MTTFVIIDESDSTDGGTLTTPILEQIAAATEEQLNTHVAPEWGGNYIVRVGTAAGLARGEVPAYILNDLPQAPDAAAYHDRSKGVPIIFAARSAFTAFTTGDRALSEGLSHEFCETVGDPSAALWSDDGTGTEQAYELCDRVQGSTYEINGVVVANFLRRNAFFPESAAPYDYLGVLDAQNDQTSGGYRIVRSASQDEHTEQRIGLGFFRHPRHGVWAEGVIDKAHLARKSHFSSRSYRRGLRLAAT